MFYFLNIAQTNIIPDCKKPVVFKYAQLLDCAHL